MRARFESNIIIRTAQLNHLASLAKWFSARLQIKWLWVRIPLLSLKLQISHLFRARSSLRFRKLLSVDSLWNANVTWIILSFQTSLYNESMRYFIKHCQCEYRIQHSFRCSFLMCLTIISVKSYYFGMKRVTTISERCWN